MNTEKTLNTVAIVLILTLSMASIIIFEFKYRHSVESNYKKSYDFFITFARVCKEEILKDQRHPDFER